jgi:hypothetical protein
MSFTPKRTQYPFSDVNIRYKSKSEALIMQNQWDTFERVENYDDVIYQMYEVGDRSKTFYLFASDAEFKAYNAGQLLHINTYPTLPGSTFASIRDRPFPNVRTKTSLPYWTGVERFVVNNIVPTASELALQQADLEVYAGVSTYNGTHVLKYQFVDGDEKAAYDRAMLKLFENA